MSILSKLFGTGSNQESDDLATAEAYVEEHGESGLVRHYSAESICDLIRYKTGAKITEDEAVDLIQNYREAHGEKPLSTNVFFPRGR